MKHLDGVIDAQVNFGASKITVYGSTTIEALEKAGAFENLKLRDEREQRCGREPIWKQKENLKVYVSTLLLLIAWFLGQHYGDGNISPTACYAASILIGGYTLFSKGLKNLSRFRFDMSTLMTIAIIGAALIGEWSEGATVVILFALSEALERFSMDKARQSIESLVDIAPKEALIRRGNQEFMISVDHIQVGDIMIVKPGQKLAMDGVVVKGTSTLNQAAITGESVPVTKTIDDEVFAGTLNEEGLIEVKVTKLVEDTTLAKIIHLVEEAQAERAPSQAFVDKFAKYYTPVIVVLAFLIAIIPPLLGGDWSHWIYQGLSVLVVGCPCALVISTPVSVVTAIGNAARNGVLIKGGIHLEEAGSLKVIAFDKTGTLTEGLPVVTDIETFGEDEFKLLAITAAIEKGSQHPLASAIMKKAEESAVNYQDVVVEDFQSITGKGVKAYVNTEWYYVGSPSFFVDIIANGIDNHAITEKISTLQSHGKTVMILGTEKKILCLIAVRDQLRSTSKEIIQKLHQLGIEKTVMLTGDNQRTAQAIGKEAGVSEIEADLLPEDKLNFIKSLRKKYHSVAMVGDGVNDAPALAASTMGVAMGGAGTDTALETADIALMSDDLRKLPFTIKLSRKALGTIKQNITFSLAVKALALLLVIPGWLTLWIAIFADMGATLIVTLNSLRLLRVKD